MARQKTKRKTKQAPTVAAEPKKIPNSWVLAKNGLSVLWNNRLLFGGITLIYGLLTILLVKGLAGGVDVSGLRRELGEVFSGGLGELASGISIFAILVGNAGDGSATGASAYQFFLLVMVSLATIWALRQVLAGHQPRIRDSYYFGMAPLVPFILILLIIGLQLIPMIIGGTIFGTVVGSGIAVHGWEKLIWGLVFAGLSLVSLYFISVSTLALYIVSLPGMTPLKALRSARDLVRNRRWLVVRKLLALPALMLLAAVVIMLPIILWLTPLAAASFFVLSLVSLLAIHAYMYSLYRELLDA